MGTPPRTDETHLDRLREDAEPARAGADTAVPPALGPGELLRYAWRQLTSMRTALFLLMLLAVAAVPGSVFPQRDIDPVAVRRYLVEHETAGPWLDRLQVFDVYSSVWFSAIYLLLFVSLVGCVLPRALVHARAVRARPPRTPARLARLPEHRQVAVAAAPADTARAAEEVLRSARFRVDVREEPGGSSAAAERGHHRETGNLVFHLSLVGLLVSVASGSLLGYEGQRLVVEGETFVGVRGDWDSFAAGPWAGEEDVPPFALRLDRMDVEFEEDQASALGQPRLFAADVTYTPRPGAEPRTQTVEVNTPVEDDGVQINLSGNGYAPVLRFTDGQGRVVHTGAVPFLPQNANYDSRGVLKVPDATDASGEQVQLGFQGVFLPTVTRGEDGTPRSIFPGDANPMLALVAYTGDLGLDDGTPQSEYVLDLAGLHAVRGADGRPIGYQLTPGQSVTLPDGLGTLTFEGVTRFASFDVRHTPGQSAALLFSLLATAGLSASLFIPRRRVWVRVRPAAGGSGGAAGGSPGGSTVEVGGLSRGSDAGLAAEVDVVVQRLAERLGEPPGARADGAAPGVGDDGTGNDQARTAAASREST
ncbi:cytochrome c biogenesis protein [Kineococcus xinjiangensis]|uniref:Cytochrome c biogenesis protein n=1 Tax=Kineococcus xinjiangensis TaxID=512762 RepID=A0A2S6IH23_9ACTN|nr:cytochrome c biogenesis protein ResB [Kineococcus xinjiangensis]PPK93515.1 cytochrome c biogenesis protein [Kineococcus xinjiangensis]